MTKLVLCLFLVQFFGVNAQVQGSLRLVGGTSTNGGRLEVYINGHWGTVCDDYWNFDDDYWSSAEARVACRQLGYTGVVTSLTSSFRSYSSSQRIWLNDVRCTGRESRLINCSHNGYGIHDCRHYNDVGIYCTPRSGDIRLVGGNSYRGRVEFYYSGQWRIPCYSGWDSTESTAVCKQLGIAEVLSTTSVYTSVSSSDKASVSCSSTSGVSSLLSCNISLYCSNNYQPYVECTDSTTSQLSNGDPRLVGGSSQYEGSVEVYYGGHWRTVCFIGFDYNASSVVCKQLGYGLVARVDSTYIRSSFDSVSVDCNGHETSLTECNISSYSDSCYPRAFVWCTDSNTPLVWTILIPLVCGLIVLWVLCVPCVVACCVYREKKPRAFTVLGNTAEETLTVRHATSDEQLRVGYPTLPSTDREGEVQINYHSGDGGQIGIDTTVGPGLVVMDQLPEDIESPPPSIQQDQPLESLQKQ